MLLQNFQNVECLFFLFQEDKSPLFCTTPYLQVIGEHRLVHLSEHIQDRTSLGIKDLIHRHALVKHVLKNLRLHLLDLMLKIFHCERVAESSLKVFFAALREFLEVGILVLVCIFGHCPCGMQSSHCGCVFGHPPCGMEKFRCGAIFGHYPCGSERFHCGGWLWPTTNTLGVECVAHLAFGLPDDNRSSLSEKL